MKSLIVISLLALCILAANQNTITLSGDFVLKYTIDGDSITFVVTGTNKGYIALGLGGSGMSKIDVAALTYSGSKVVVEDRNNMDDSNKVDLDTTNGGNSDYTIDDSSTYSTTTGAWSAKFSRKLNTGDKYDSVITDGADINLAFAVMSDFSWKQHTSAKYWTVKLNTASTSDPNTHSSILAISSFLLAIFMILF